MTDDHSPLDPTAGPLDDEVVSAVLDGEATPAERALVEGSVEGRARLAELRGVAAATATPIAPLPADTVEVLLGRALDAASTPTPASAPAPVALATRRAQRDHSELWRRWGTAIAAAAAIVVVVAGIVALGKTAGRSSSDSASSATAADGGSASATSTTIGPGTGAESSRAAEGMAPPSLGALADADLVLDRYAVLVGLDPSVDHQFDAGPASGSGAGAADSSGPVPEAEATAAYSAACPVPPIAVAPGEAWAVTATAELPGGPVLVMGNGLAPPANRVLVVDVGTCTVLAERTL